MNNKFRRIIIASFFFVIFVSLAARFYDLEMDPFLYNDYGTSWVDEGSWIHNARNKVLFGKFESEGEVWNPMYISPIFNYLQLISFRALGVNTVAMRLVPAILGVISILVASLLIMLKKYREGIIYLILLSINTMHIAYSRTAVPESTALFFVLIILGLIIYDKTYSWVIAGFFLPFLFFSKTTTLFLIIAPPLSLILYYLIYKSRKEIKKLVSLCIGGVISMLIWLSWLVPVFDKWLFLNFGLFDQRIYVNLFKIAGTLLYALKFSLINIVAVVLAATSIYFTVLSIKRKLKTKANKKSKAKEKLKAKKIEFVDFFLALSLVLFLLQAVVFDFPLRRFILTLPIVLLIAARFLSNLQNLSFTINNKTINLTRTTALHLIIGIYVVTNFIPIGFYFSELSVRDDYAHTFVRNSKEIGSILPAEAKVYGDLASSLRVENDMQPFIAYNAVRLGCRSEIEAYFDKYGMDYAIFKLDIFNKVDMGGDELNLEGSGVAGYLRDNFELMARLNSKDHWTNNLDRKIYIYKRIQQE